MSESERSPYADRFLATAEAVALARPDVDVELAREVLLEAATLLHNGLVLDGLDEHDLEAVLAALCADLVAPDPGVAIRLRSRETLQRPGDLHDPESVSRALLIAAATFGL